MVLVLAQTSWAARVERPKRSLGSPASFAANPVSVKDVCIVDPSASQHSRSSRLTIGVQHYQVVNRIGDLAVVAYHLQQGLNAGTKVTLVGGGYVSSFTRQNPSAPAESQVNNLLILDSVHQADDLARNAGRGVHDFKAMAVGDSDAGETVVKLLDRDIKIDLVAGAVRPRQTFESLAVLAGDPPGRSPSIPGGLVAESTAKAAVKKEPLNVEQAVRLIGGVMRKFPSLSPEEARRVVVEEAGDEAKLTREGVQKEIAPQLPRRETDRLGELPNFVMAAHLAQYLIGAPIGAIYDSALKDFRADHSEIDHFWGKRFGIDDLEALQKAYAFVPQWRDQRKGKRDVSIAGVRLTNQLGDLEGAIRDKVLDDIRLLSSIPLSSLAPGHYRRIRQEAPLLENGVLVTSEVPTVGSFARYHDLILNAKAEGKAIRIVVPADSLDPRLPEYRRWRSSGGEPLARV